MASSTILRTHSPTPSPSRPGSPMSCGTLSPPSVDQCSPRTIDMVTAFEDMAAQKERTGTIGMALLTKSSASAMPSNFHKKIENKLKTIEHSNTFEWDFDDKSMDKILPAKRSHSISVPTLTSKYSNISSSSTSSYASTSDSSAIPNVYPIFATQAVSAIHNHYSTPLPPTDEVFPWLHGLHKQNSSQRSFLDPARPKQYFYAFDPNYMPPAIPNPSSYKGLLLVKVGNQIAGSLIGSVMAQDILKIPSDVEGLNLNTILGKGSLLSQLPLSFAHFRKSSSATSNSNADSISPSTSICSSSSSSFSSQSSTSFSTAIPALDFISSSKQRKQVVKICKELQLLPEFVDLDPPAGISLRNFHIQVAKFATVSDVIVYGDGTESPKEVEKTAKLISLAQQVVRNNQLKMSVAESLPVYKTFVLKDPFNEISKIAPELIHIPYIPSSTLFSVPKTMAELKDVDDANEILKSALLHNWDKNYLFREQLEMSILSSSSVIENGVWLGNFADVGAFERYQQQKNKDHNIEDDNKDNYRLSSFPNRLLSLEEADLISEVLWHEPPYSISTSKLTGRVSYPKESKNWKTFVSCTDTSTFPNIEDIEKLFEITTKDDKSACENELTVSIEFPSSGSIGLGDMTESDLLCFINVLKLIYIRSSDNTPTLFFCNDGYTETSMLAIAYIVYSKGVTVAEAYKLLHTTYNRPFFTFSSDKDLLSHLQDFILHFSPVRLNKDSNHSWNPYILDKPKNGFRSVSRLLLNPTVEDWFVRSDGSLPSRILPHLYLGGIAHVNNVKMLNEIGIKRIISVGEAFNWLPINKKYIESEIVNETYQIFKLKPNCESLGNIREILCIPLIQDDGIDQLSQFLEPCLNFLDEAHKKNEPALVHCRAGVSRSATICIAEVMKKLDLDVAKAYLFVRVRRLNVIIQPNLKFMWELFVYGEWLKRDKLKKLPLTEKTGKQRWLREVDWHIFCREVYLMNSVYISS